MQGKLDEAEKYFRKAIEGEPKNLEARYKLSQIVAKQGGDEADAREQELLEEVLAIEPGNLFILLKRLSVAVCGRNDRKAKRETMAQLNKLAPAWSGAGAADARKHLIDLAPTVAGPPSPRSYIGVGQLENLLRPEPTYQRSRFAVDAPGAQAGKSFQTFLRLTPVRSTPAPPDRELAFEVKPVAGAAITANVVVPVWLTGEGAPAVFVANGKEARQAGSKAPALLFPGGATATPPSPTACWPSTGTTISATTCSWPAPAGCALPARCEGALHRRHQKDQDRAAREVAERHPEWRLLRRLGGGYRDGRRPGHHPGAALGAADLAAQQPQRQFQGAADLPRARERARLRVGRPRQ